jgi:hypothetical protein
LEGLEQAVILGVAAISSRISFTSPVPLFCCVCGSGSRTGEYLSWRITLLQAEVRICVKCLRLILHEQPSHLEHGMSCDQCRGAYG